MKIRAELIKVLIFALVAGMFGAVLYITLARDRIGASRDYAAVLTNVSGLQPGDPVRIAGVRMGQVDSISFVKGNDVKIDFHVKQGQQLTDQTRLFVRYENLLGDRYVELAQSPGQGSVIKPGTTIPATMTSPALDLDTLLNGFKPLFAGLEPDQINSLATKLINTLQGRSGTVQELLAQTASLTGDLADRDQVIGSTVDNLNVVLGTLDANDSQLRGTITQLQELITGLAGDRDPIGRAVVGINKLTVSVEQLLRAVRPALKDDITRARLVTAIINRNEPELRSILTEVPKALQVLSRVGSHGAFFNFYLCGVSLRITGPTGPIDVPGLNSNSSEARCQPLPKYQKGAGQ